METDIMALRVPGRSRKYAVLLMILMLSCREKQARPLYLNMAGLNISTDGPLTLVNGKPVNAVLFTLYPTTDTMLVIGYRNGREDGISKSFYPNKQIKELRYFSNGWKEGKHRGWYENGNLAFEYNFRKDMFDGNYREWTETGVLFRDMNYREGKEEGSQTVRFADGKIKSNYVIREGKRYGLLGTKSCVNVSDSISIEP
jgi:hypothetical protein